MKKLCYNLFIKETTNVKLQFLRYVFVGGFAAVINIGSLFIFKEVFNLQYLLANIVGFILGLVVNYMLSRVLVFSKEKTNNQIFEFVTYAVIGVIGLGLDTCLMWFGTSIVGIYYLLTKIISTGIVFIWNFFARKILYIILDKRGNIKNEK